MKRIIYLVKKESFIMDISIKDQVEKKQLNANGKLILTTIINNGTNLMDNILLMKDDDDDDDDDNKKNKKNKNKKNEKNKNNNNNNNNNNNKISINK